MATQGNQEGGARGGVPTTPGVNYQFSITKKGENSQMKVKSIFQKPGHYNVYVGAPGDKFPETISEEYRRGLGAGFALAANMLSNMKVVLPEEPVSPQVVLPVPMSPQVVLPEPVSPKLVLPEWVPQYSLHFSTK